MTYETDDDRKSEQIFVRVTPRVKKLVEQRAAEEMRPVGEYVRSLVETWVQFGVLRRIRQEDLQCPSCGSRLQIVVDLKVRMRTEASTVIDLDLDERKES